MADSPSELNAAVEKLERKHNENPEGRYFAPLADNYRKLGELETAEQLLREGLRRHPDYLSAHVVLGRCLVDRGALADARSEFGHVLSVDPQNLVALKAMGEIAAGSGERAEAERWYRELLAVDPMNEDARTALASLEEPAGALAEPGDARADQDGASWEPLPALDLEPGPADAASGAPDADAADDAGLAWEPLPAADDAPAAPSSGADAEPADARQDGAPSDDARQDGDEAAFEPLDLDMALPGFSTSSIEADAGADEGEVAAASFRIEGLEGSSGFEPSGEVSEPVDEEEEEVVTETIAELYAQQGFHDRAAEVYRRLLRERGEDAGLRERLEEMERLSRGEAAESAPAAEPWESGDAAATAGEEPALPTFGETAASGAAEPWGQPAGPEDDGDDPFASSFRYGFAGAPAEGARPTAADEPATGWAGGTDTTDEGADPWLSSGAGFAASGMPDAGAGFDPSGLYDGAGVDHEAGMDDAADAAGSVAPDTGAASGSTFGFEQAPSGATGGNDYDAEPWDIGSLEPARPGTGSADAAPEDAEGPWGGAQATDAAPEGETSRPASVRAYLSELIAWPAVPSGATRAAEAPTAEQPTTEEPATAAPTTAGADEPAWWTPDGDETPEAGTGFGTEAEPPAATGPETEPFPGAAGVPSAEQVGAEPSADTGAADDLLPWEQPVESDAPAGAAAGGGFSFEDFFDEKEEAAPAPEATPAAETPTPAPEPEPEPSRAEDEEDLESFQAWLRGLRR